MLQVPSVLLALLFASTYAAAAFFWRGQSLRDLARYWLASVVGFAAGQLLAGWLGLVPISLGSIRIVEATAGALLCMALAHAIRRR